MKSRLRAGVAGQLALDLTPPAAVALYASTKDGPLPVLVDQDTADRLKGRRVHIGSHGYCQLWNEGRVTLLHRWIFGLKIGDPRVVDHINGDAHDCQLSNLRVVSRQENSANRKSTGASGVLGVYPVPSGKWMVRDRSGGGSRYLGVYADLAEAARVSDPHRRANQPGYLGRGCTLPAQAARSPRRRSTPQEEP